MRYIIDKHILERVIAMAFSNIDRTSQVETLFRNELPVKSTDYCRFYVKHPDTFLQRKECWTCRYSNFGIEYGNPTDTGLCKYQELSVKM